LFTADARTLSRIEPSVRRVVILDPNVSSARLLSDIMKGLGAREVYVESDEERALELLRDVEPGIIFTERSGETLNGETLARRVRRSSMACRMSPIIMVTGEATAAAIKGARDAGVHEFLRKPYTTGDLFKRVENVALKPRPWVEAVGYVGPDRRRFNSGEYSGARKRRADGSTGEAIDIRDQATRILVAAMAQFDQDPAQATRAIRQQAQTLKAFAVKTSDAKLAIAAGGLEAFMAAGAVTKAGLAQPVGAIMALNTPTPASMARAS
jgi:two-component system, response regulator PdtaR